MALFQFQINLGPEDEEFTVSVNSVRLGSSGEYCGRWEDSHPGEADELDYDIWGLDGAGRALKATPEEIAKIDSQVVEIYLREQYDY